MELEAAPRQSIERAAAAPVERQKAARLAGGCTGDGVTLYDSRPAAASACEVGDRGADCATTADHAARTRAHRTSIRLARSRTGHLLCSDTDLHPLVNMAIIGLVLMCGGVDVLRQRPLRGVAGCRGHGPVRHRHSR